MDIVPSRSRVLTIGHGALALLLTIVLTWAGAVLADIYHLPFIHGWALVHGTIFVMFPLYFVISYYAVRPLIRVFRINESEEQNLEPRRVSMLALSSLLLSGTGFIIPLVGSVIGVVLGHMARGRCRKDPTLSGAGFALAGLVVGYLAIAFAVFDITAAWYASKAFHGS
jgi:MFS family permease